MIESKPTPIQKANRVPMIIRKSSVLIEGLAFTEKYKFERYNRMLNPFTPPKTDSTEMSRYEYRQSGWWDFSSQ